MKTSYKLKITLNNTDCADGIWFVDEYLNKNLLDSCSFFHTISAASEAEVNFKIKLIKLHNNILNVESI